MRHNRARCRIPAPADRRQQSGYFVTFAMSAPMVNDPLFPSEHVIAGAPP